MIAVAGSSIAVGRAVRRPCIGLRKALVHGLTCRLGALGLIAAFVETRLKERFLVATLVSCVGKSAPEHADSQSHDGLGPTNLFVAAAGEALLKLALSDVVAACPAGPATQLQATVEPLPGTLQARLLGFSGVDAVAQESVRSDMAETTAWPQASGNTLGDDVERLFRTVRHRSAILPAVVERSSGATFAEVGARRIAAFLTLLVKCLSPIAASFFVAAVLDAFLKVRVGPTVTESRAGVLASLNAGVDEFPGLRPALLFRPTGFEAVDQSVVSQMAAEAPAGPQTEVQASHKNGPGPDPTFLFAVPVFQTLFVMSAGESVAAIGTGRVAMVYALV